MKQTGTGAGRKGPEIKRNKRRRMKNRWNREEQVRKEKEKK